MAAGSGDNAYHAPHPVWEKNVDTRILKGNVAVPKQHAWAALPDKVRGYALAGQQRESCESPMQIPMIGIVAVVHPASEFGGSGIIQQQSLHACACCWVSGIAGGGKIQGGEMSVQVRLCFTLHPVESTVQQCFSFGVVF